MSQARYDSIGKNYATTRREDPFILSRISSALGDARTVLNVGAGAGSYEPSDRVVMAVEPSQTMALQRRSDRLPAIRATADKLPFHNKSFDAAMTVLSLHHWEPDPKLGIRELCRVAREKVVIVTIDPRPSGAMWLMADYLTEIAELDHHLFPLPEVICGWLDCPTQIEILPIHRDTPDWNLLSFWAHPERVLDPKARAATSGFARQPEDVVERVVSAVRRDLDSGAWDERHGHLRTLKEIDVGLRLIAANINRIDR